MRNASLAGDRDERRRRRDHDGFLLLAIVRHRHRLHRRVLGHQLLTLLAHDLLHAQLLHGLALLALLLLLAREECLHPLRLLDLLLVGLLLGLLLSFLLLHLLDGTLAAPRLSLGHALLVLRCLALRKLRQALLLLLFNRASLERSLALGLELGQKLLLLALNLALLLELGQERVLFGLDLLRIHLRS